MGYGDKRRQRWAPDRQAHHSHLQGSKDTGRIQEGTEAGQGDLTRVWLAERRVAPLSSPLMGSKGMVPNF